MNKIPRGQLSKKKKPKGPKLLYPNFHNRVKVILAIREKTMVELAEFLNMTRQGLYLHLKAANPNLFIAILIADYLNVSLGSLFDDPLLDETDINIQSPQYFLFKNRVKMYMDKQGLGWQTLGLYFGMSPADIEAKVELIERNGVQSKSNRDMEEGIYKVLKTDYDKFHYLKDGNLHERNEVLADIENHVQKPPKTIKEWNALYSEKVTERVNSLTEIIIYYTVKYPDDRVSMLLRPLMDLDTLDSDHPVKKN
jgi:DNA-binding XRE family transcriptional regulator